MSTGMLIAVAAAIVAIAIALAGWIYVQKEKSRKLRRRFGLEYDRLVKSESGNVRRAEAILEDRQRRVTRLNIRRLNVEERERFTSEWRRAQERFVDDPKAAVAEADALVNLALKTRGYPIGDFEQRAADISVEHPQVVEHYRIAHNIAMRDTSGEATTEDLRLAMQHYRDLFEDVLDTRVTESRVTRPEEIHR